MYLNICEVEFDYYSNTWIFTKKIAIFGNCAIIGYTKILARKFINWQIGI